MNFRTQQPAHRRTTVLGITVGVAALAVGGLLAGAPQLTGNTADAAISSPQQAAATAPAAAAAAASASAAKAKAAFKEPTPKETLATFKKLLPSRLKTTNPQTSGDDFIGVSYVVDDGKGRSTVEALLQSTNPVKNCKDQGAHCTVRKDGSVQLVSQMVNPTNGAVSNYVTVSHRDNRTISVGSMNTTDFKHAKPTRALPPLSIAQLLKIADQKAWHYPSAAYGEDLNP